MRARKTEAAFGSVPSEPTSMSGAINADRPNSASNEPETIISSLSMFAPSLGILFGAREKVLDQRERLCGRLDHGRMTGAVEDHDLGAGHALIELGAFRRDQRVL